MDVSADDNINALYAVILGSRGADTTWRILSNNGAGAQFATDTGVTIDNAITTFELYAYENRTNKWRYAINGAWADLTTADIPSQGAGLAPYAQLGTSTTAAKAVDVFGIYVESN